MTLLIDSRTVTPASRVHIQSVVGFKLTNVIFRIHVHGHIFHFVKKWTIHAHES